MQLWKHILPLQQQVSDYGTSALLLYLTRERIEKIEEASRSDDVVKKYINKLKNLAERAVSLPDQVQHQIELKEVFSEALMYVRLKSKGTVERINEVKDQKRPDFKFTSNGASSFIEVKALNMTGGAQIHKAIQDEGLENKASMQGELQSGKRQVAFREQEIQPYATAGGEAYDPHSTRFVIETLVRKVEQNLKKDQFALGDSILLIDLCQQLLLHDSAEEHSKKNFLDATTVNPVSGELWHLAFGEVDQAITKHISFKGESNEDGKLLLPGILSAHVYVKALVVHVEDRFFGFVINSNASDSVNKVLSVICERVVRI